MQSDFGNQGSMQTVSQPMAPRQVIYGRRSVSGTISYLQVTPGGTYEEEQPDS